jgi:hypothetical protein
MKYIECFYFRDESTGAAPSHERYIAQETAYVASGYQENVQHALKFAEESLPYIRATLSRDSVESEAPVDETHLEEVQGFFTQYEQAVGGEITQDEVLNTLILHYIKNQHSGSETPENLMFSESNTSLNIDLNNFPALHTWIKTHAAEAQNNYYEALSSAANIAVRFQADFDPNYTLLNDFLIDQDTLNQFIQGKIEDPTDLYNITQNLERYNTFKQQLIEAKKKIHENYYHLIDQGILTPEEANALVTEKSASYDFSKRVAWKRNAAGTLIATDEIVSKDAAIKSFKEKMPTLDALAPDEYANQFLETYFSTLTPLEIQRILTDPRRLLKPGWAEFHGERVFLSGNAFTKSILDTLQQMRHRTSVHKFVNKHGKVVETFAANWTFPMDDLPTDEIYESLRSTSEVEIDPLEDHIGIVGLEEVLEKLNNASAETSNQNALEITTKDPEVTDESTVEGLILNDTLDASFREDLYLRYNAVFDAYGLASFVSMPEFEELIETEAKRIIEQESPQEFSALNARLDSIFNNPEFQHNYKGEAVIEYPNGVTLVLASQNLIVDIATVEGSTTMQVMEGKEDHFMVSKFELGDVDIHLSNDEAASTDSELSIVDKEPVVINTPLILTEGDTPDFIEGEFEDI